MNAFDHFVEELQTLAPFRIRYKDEATEMQLLHLITVWFCPEFLTRYTTIIGSTIYFPSRAYVERYPKAAMQTLAHEVVHLLDGQRISFPVFGLSYLFPQILGLGVLLFPWIGLWSLFFLVFLAPWPAPLRAYFEARAYAIDYLAAPKPVREALLTNLTSHFSSWDYYRMFPFEDWVATQIKQHAQSAENGTDPTLLKVLLVYEMAMES